MLEKKRQLLQRELEKQMAVDGGATVDPSAIAPGSSTKGLKANLPNTKSSIAGTFLNNFSWASAARGIIG